jgi:hypothetical protein
MSPRFIIEMVKASNFWLNVFPYAHGISDVLSPCQIVTGSKIDFNLQCHLAFHSYVQTHEAHDNTMAPHTIGALALWPTGNVQGGFHFYSLTSGKVNKRNHWTELPMPNEVIDKVHTLARRANAARGPLAFFNGMGMPLDDDQINVNMADGDESDDDDDEIYHAHAADNDDVPGVDLDNPVDIPGVDPVEIPGEDLENPGVDLAANPAMEPEIPGVDPAMEPENPGVDPAIEPENPGVDPAMELAVPGVDPDMDPLMKWMLHMVPALVPTIYVHVELPTLSIYSPSMVSTKV